MKKVLLAICTLLVLISAGFAQRVNWTAYNSNTYHWLCSASGSACVVDGVVATWTLPRNITVTSVEYQSTGAIYQTSSTNANLVGPCPAVPTISLTDGVATYTLNITGTGYAGAPLYSSTNAVKWGFKSGRELSILSQFASYVRSGGVAGGGNCSIPPGNVVVSYTSP